MRSRAFPCPCSSTPRLANATRNCALPPRDCTIRCVSMPVRFQTVPCCAFACRSVLCCATASLCSPKPSRSCTWQFPCSPVQRRAVALSRHATLLRCLSTPSHSVSRHCHAAAERFYPAPTHFKDLLRQRQTVQRESPAKRTMRHHTHARACCSMPLQLRALPFQSVALLCFAAANLFTAFPLQFRLRNYHKAVSFRVSTENSSENGSSEACTSAGRSFCEDFTIRRVPARLCVVSCWIGLFCVLRGLCVRGINTGQKEKDAVRGPWWPLAW